MILLCIIIFSSFIFCLCVIIFILKISDNIYTRKEKEKRHAQYVIDMKKSRKFTEELSNKNYDFFVKGKLE